MCVAGCESEQSPVSMAGCALRLLRLSDEDVVKEAGSQRITDDLFHWNAINFRRYWRMSIAACLARERGRVGMRAALGDWAKRETNRMVAVGAAIREVPCTKYGS